MPWSAWFFPFLAVAFYALSTLTGFGGTFTPSPAGIGFATALVPVLFGAVFAAVYHAEVIAHRTGEPYGTLVLTVAVTVIEVALITTVMLSNGDDATNTATIARDTVFAVVMIVCSGLVGICIFVGGLHHHEQGFRVTGAASYLAVLQAMCVLVLVLPNYTVSVPGPVYGKSQLIFVSVVTIALYGVFLYIQTVKHRDYFIMNVWKKSDLAPEDLGADGSTSDGHAGDVPSNREVAISGVFLMIALTGVILLAKKFAAVAEAATTAIGAPDAVVGVVVALVILLPEGVAAVNAARNNELQKSINLALGSTLATIGLTIPTIAVVSLVIGQTLVLGLDNKDALLMLLTLGISILTFGSGRTNLLFGFVHIVVFATFLFLTFVP
jgi:Ca2+:H+ antiporter